SRIHSDEYGFSDGMKSSECNGANDPAGWKMRDGKLWFPTIQGVTVVDPNHLPINHIPPNVIVEEMQVDEKIITPGAATISFPPGKEKFEFEYTALSFLSPEKVTFRYKLEGFDRDWIDAGRRRVAYYTNIPPGDYRFSVMACNNDGVWNTKGASVAF